MKTLGVDYFRRRAEEERLAAESATSEEARWAHLELASMHEKAAAAGGLAIVERVSSPAR